MVLWCPVSCGFGGGDQIPAEGQQAAEERGRKVSPLYRHQSSPMLDGGGSTAHRSEGRGTRSGSGSRNGSNMSTLCVFPFFPSSSSVDFHPLFFMPSVRGPILMLCPLPLYCAAGHTSGVYPLFVGRLRWLSVTDMLRLVPRVEATIDPCEARHCERNPPTADTILAEKRLCPTTQALVIVIQKLMSCCCCCCCDSTNLHHHSTCSHNRRRSGLLTFHLCNLFPRELSL